jgi:hypothetical protein
LKICSVGDLSFEGEFADRIPEDFFAGAARSLSGFDLAIGNLECVLSTSTEGAFGKCTLRGHPAWAHSLRKAGIQLVTLANNHAMDFDTPGLLDTIRALDEAGIRYVGAGRNLDEARAPVIMELRGRRIGFLGRTGVHVGARTKASSTEAGVAFLEEEELLEDVRRLAKQVDDVFVLLHWGVEEYLMPAPSQRRFARQLAAAGCSVLFGHHPHVLQGVETFGRCLVFYSLGNFAFNEFDWTYVDDAGAKFPQHSPLTDENRLSVIACATRVGDAYQQGEHVFTKIGARGEPLADSDATRARHWAALRRRVNPYTYGAGWLLHGLEREWTLRFAKTVSPDRLRRIWKLRPKHVLELIRTLRTSSRMISEKTKNPYE